MMPRALLTTVVLLMPTVIPGVAAALEEAALPPRDAATSEPLFLIRDFARMPPLGSWDAGGDVDTHWEGLIAKFREWGWSGPIHAVGWYECDRGATMLDASKHGIGANEDEKHKRHHADGSHDGRGCNFFFPGKHGRNAEIEHLAYHVAWAMHESTPQGGCSKVVAQGMGGLMLRYALLKAGSDPDFPPRLCVSDVVAMDVPWYGYGYAATCAGLARQCVQLRDGSAFTTSLMNAPLGSTDWTVIGSEFLTSLGGVWAENAIGWDRHDVARDLLFQHKAVYNLAADFFIRAEAADSYPIKSWEVFEGDTRTFYHEDPNGDGPLRYTYLSLIHGHFGCGSSMDHAYPVPNGRWVEGDPSRPVCHYRVDVPYDSTRVHAEALTRDAGRWAPLELTARHQGNTKVCMVSASKGTDLGHVASEQVTPPDRSSWPPGWSGCRAVFIPPPPVPTPVPKEESFNRMADQANTILEVPGARDLASSFLSRALGREILLPPGFKVPKATPLIATAMTDPGEAFRQGILAHIINKVGATPVVLATRTETFKVASPGAPYVVRGSSAMPDDCGKDVDAGRSGDPLGDGVLKLALPTTGCRGALDRLDDVDVFVFTSPRGPGTMTLTIAAEADNAVPLDVHLERTSGSATGPLATATLVAGRTFTHTWDSVGSSGHALTLTVPVGSKDALAERLARYNMTLHGNGAPHSVTFECPSSAERGATITCKASAQDEDPTLEFTVDWGDGTTPETRTASTSAGPATLSFTRTLAKNGIHRPQLQVRDAAPRTPLASAPVEGAISVEGPNTAPTLAAPSCSQDMASTLFRWSCRVTTQDADSLHTHFYVNWGDGSPEERVPSLGETLAGRTQEVAHAYASSGPFEASFVAEDGHPSRPMRSKEHLLFANRILAKAPALSNSSCVLEGAEVRCSGDVGSGAKNPRLPSCGDHDQRGARPRGCNQNHQGSVVLDWGDGDSSIVTYSTSHWRATHKYRVPPTTHVHALVSSVSGATRADAPLLVLAPTARPPTAPSTATPVTPATPGYTPSPAAAPPPPSKAMSGLAVSCASGQGAYGQERVVTCEAEAPTAASTSGATVIISWGDGMASAVLPLQGGRASASHHYQRGGAYPVTAMFRTPGAHGTAAMVMAFEENARPAIELGCLQVEQGSRRASCRVTVFDDGTQPTTVAVDWGDGRSPDTWPVAPLGGMWFSATLPRDGVFPVTAFVMDKHQGTNGQMPRTSPSLTANVLVGPAFGRICDDCANRAPEPMLPACDPGLTVTCRLGAKDPDGDRYYLVLGWGDAAQRVPATGTLASGETVVVKHTYRSAGTYPVTVVAVDADEIEPKASALVGSRVRGGEAASTSFTSYATLYRAEAAGPNAAPSLDALACAPTQATAPVLVRCTATARDDWGPLSVRVDWGDGSPATTIDTAPESTFAVEHRYDRAGGWRVNANLTDGSLSASREASISVAAPPRAAPSSPSLGCAASGLADHAAVCRVHTQGSSGIAYLVDWGDGAALERVPPVGSASASAPESVHHVFASTSATTVRVRAVLSDDATVGSTFASVPFTPSAREAGRPTLVGPDCVEDAARPLHAVCAFGAAGAAAATGDVAYEVDWGDGSAPARVPTSGWMSPSKRAGAERDFTAEGARSVRVRLLVPSGLGAEGVASLDLRGRATAPSLGIACSIPEDAARVVCEATSAPEEKALTLSIDWGDGTPPYSTTLAGDGVSVHHGYQAAGQYTVRAALGRTDGAGLPSFSATRVDAPACASKATCGPDGVLTEVVERELPAPEGRCTRAERAERVLLRCTLSHQQSSLGRFVVEVAGGPQEFVPPEDKPAALAGQSVVFEREVAAADAVQVGIMLMTQDGGVSPWTWRFLHKPVPPTMGIHADCFDAVAPVGGVVSCIVLGNAGDLPHVDYEVAWGDGTQETRRSLWGEPAVLHHRYAAAGSYQPTFTAKDAASGTVSAPVPVEVTIKATTAGPKVVSVDCSDPAAPADEATCTVELADAQGTTTAIVTWGDGASEEVQTSSATLVARHRYAAPGAKDVYFTVHRNGDATFAADAILVGGQRRSLSPITDLTCTPKAVQPGQSVTCTASVAAAMDVGYSVTWSDETAPRTYDVKAGERLTVTRTFDRAGTPSIRIFASAPGVRGGSIASLSVSVAGAGAPSAPVVELLDCGGTAKVGEPVTCRARATGGSELRYAFSWGDEEATAMEPLLTTRKPGETHTRVHTFAAPGRYEVAVFAQAGEKHEVTGSRSTTVVVS